MRLRSVGEFWTDSKVLVVSELYNVESLELYQGSFLQKETCFDPWLVQSPVFCCVNF